MNKILELIEAQKLFNIPIQKLEILIHPDSLVHAILELKNGLTKFIYHKTSMIIPLANAIFDDNLDINEFLNLKKEKEFKDLISKINTDIFPIAKIKNRLNEYPSTSVIINASNEILVDQFLSKNLPFLAINKIILAILKDRNYKNYAIRKPNNLKQINIVDKWARNITLKKLNHMLFKISRIVITLFFLGSTFANAEVVNKVVIKGNKRVSEETIKVYGEIKTNKDYSESDINEVLNNLYSTIFLKT